MNFYMRAHRLLAGFVRFALRVKVTGAETVPPAGGCLVCANHTGILDVFALGAAFPRQLRFLAKAELFRVPVVAPLVRALGAYSVDRGHNDVGAIKKTLALLKDGELVCMFPQGTRYKGVDPRETRIKNGVAMAAYHAKAPVLPVYIKLKNYKYALFRRVEVIIGRPIPYEALGFSGGGSAEYGAVARKIFDEICALRGF